MAQPGVMPTQSPLTGPGRWRRCLPFWLAGALGLALAWPLPVGGLGVWLLELGMSGAIVASMVVLPWRRWPEAWQATPAFVFYAVVMLLGVAGAELIYVALAFMPVLWLALYHSRGLLAAGLALLPVVLLVPEWLASRHELSVDWRRVVVAVALACLTGVIGQRLVANLRPAGAELAAALDRRQVDHDLTAAVLDTAACLVIVVDRAGLVTLVNHEWERLTGRRARQVIGRPVWEIGLSPDHAQRSRQVLGDVVGGRFPQGSEDDWLDRDGRAHRIAWNHTALLDADAQVTHVVGTGVDVSDQRHSARLVEGVLAAATEQAIFATDVRGVFTLFNVGAERMLGFRAAELVGRASASILYVPVEVAYRAAELGVPAEDAVVEVARQQGAETREWTFLRRDGTSLPVCVSVTAMRDEEGHLVGYAGVATDITAQWHAATATNEALQRERLAAQRLRDLDKVRSDFVASVSHELRTPLTSIVGNTEVVLDGDAGPLTGMQTKLLDAVSRNAHRLNGLVNDLLLLSHVNSDRTAATHEVLDLQALLDTVLDAVSAQAQARGLGLSVDVPAGLRVHGDRHQLRRVIVNLADNAVKFTPPGGHVAITATPVGAFVQVEVTDTGMGIPEEEIPRVFDRFFRSSLSQFHEMPGIGLGLAIAKSIVDIHGGALWLSSPGGQGVTATLQLPAAACQPAPTPEPATPTPS
jgi:PAS domain S-box-containing protein